MASFYRAESQLCLSVGFPTAWLGLVRHGHGRRGIEDSVGWVRGVGIPSQGFPLLRSAATAAGLAILQELTAWAYHGLEEKEVGVVQLVYHPPDTEPRREHIAETGFDPATYGL